MKALVIGASGFLGKAVMRELLTRGHDVVGTSKSTRGYVSLDVTDQGSCVEMLSQGHFDSVINLAASGVTSGTATDLEMHSVNSTGSLVLSQAIAALATAPWFLHVSSSTEPLYGEAGESAYSDTKRKGTDAVAVQLLASGLPHGIVRLHNTYGPGQPSGRFVMGALLRLRERSTIRLHHPDRIRDFSYMADVVGHLVDLLEEPQEGGVLREIGTGRGLSLKDAAHIICGCVGAPSDLVLYDSTTLKDAHSVQVADTASKNFLECRTSFEAGVTATAADLRLIS